MSANEIHVQLRTASGDEMMVRGQPELVGRFMRAFGVPEDNFSQEVEIVSTSPVREVVEERLPSPTGNGSLAAATAPSTTNLVNFYRQLNPQSQTEQVLVITYFMQNYEGLESLALEDYDRAYNLLRRIPVESPSNLKSSVRNVVDRTKYLRNADRGRYMLTIEGEELVQRMIADRQGNV